MAVTVISFGRPRLPGMSGRPLRLLPLPSLSMPSPGTSAAFVHSEPDSAGCFSSMAPSITTTTGGPEGGTAGPGAGAGAGAGSQGRQAFPPSPPGRETKASSSGERGASGAGRAGAAPEAAGRGPGGGRERITGAESDSPGPHEGRCDPPNVPELLGVQR